MLHKCDYVGCNYNTDSKSHFNRHKATHSDEKKI